MTVTELAVFGIASGILNIVAFIPYTREILRGNTKPQRATYWIWFTVSAVGFLGQRAGGAHWSLVWAFSSLLGTGIVAGLSVKYGYGTFHLRDGLGLAATTIGVVLALLLSSPLVAVLTVVLIDAVGSGLTLHKTWLAPDTEPLFAWIISLVAATCGLIAVGHWLPVIFLAPLLNFVINVLMVWLIAHHKPELTLSSIAVEEK
jgi:hypothetical protein